MLETKQNKQGEKKKKKKTHKTVSRVTGIDDKEEISRLSFEEVGRQPAGVTKIAYARGGRKITQCLTGVEANLSKFSTHKGNDRCHASVGGVTSAYVWVATLNPKKGRKKKKNLDPDVVRFQSCWMEAIFNYTEPDM